MALAVSLLHGVRPNTGFVHRQRQQGDAEPGGNPLDKGICYGLDPTAAAGWHQRGEGGCHALAAVGGEHQLFGFWRPILTGEKHRGDVSRIWRSDAGRLSQRDIERFRPFQSLQALRNQGRLRLQRWIIELQIDAGSPRFARNGYPALSFAGNEGAASDLTDDEAATQQFG